jgi:hypothetical protein
MWGAVERGWSAGWAFVAGVVSACAAAYLVSAKCPAQAVERRLSELRPGAVILFRGPGYASIGPQGVELWQINPLRRSRAIEWADVSRFMVGLVGTFRGFDSLTPTEVELSKTYRIGGTAPALRLDLADAEAGYLIIDSPRLDDPWRAASALQHIADRRPSSASTLNASDTWASGSTIGIVGDAASNPVGLAAPLDHLAGSRRPPPGHRLPLANRWFWPTAGFARWSGLGLALGLAMALIIALREGLDDWAVVFGAAAPLVAGASLGLASHLRRRSLRGPALIPVRLAAMAVLVAVGAASGTALGALASPNGWPERFDLSVRPESVESAPPTGQAGVPTVAESTDPGEAPASADQYFRDQRGAAAVGQEELDPAGSPNEWVGKLVPPGAAAKGERFLTVLTASLATLPPQYRGVSENLIRFSRCRMDRDVGVGQGSACDTVQFREGDWDYAFIAYEDDRILRQAETERVPAAAHEAPFSFGALDPSLIAGMGDLCDGLEADPSAILWGASMDAYADPDGPVLVHSLSCSNAEANYRFEINASGTLWELYRSPK